MADKPTFDPADLPPDASDPPDTPADSGALAVLQRERDDFYDRLLRKTAEFDNYRRRIERERREQADQAIVDLLQDVLFIVDDFDLARNVEAGDGAQAYKKGIELIHGKLHDLLKRYHVRPIQSLGADFDPNLHQAVIHEVSPEHREGEVIGELRRGYTIGEKLLRPAMVKVAKA